MARNSVYPFPLLTLQQTRKEKKNRAPLATTFAEGADRVAPSRDYHSRLVPIPRSRPPADLIAAGGVDRRQGIRRGVSSSMGPDSYKQPKLKN